MIAEQMNTENMTKFLKQVSRAHRNHFIVMVVEGASSHKAKPLEVPSNLTLILLPPYSPELNPAERIWNLTRRDYFANRYFDTLDEAVTQAKLAMKNLKADKNGTKTLTLWPLIAKAIAKLL
jgi:transposase